jgi:signal transduction histidine kinase/BarA-like signal transduction histidine kinase
MSEFSQRRIKLVYTLSLFTALLASLWFVMSVSFEVYALATSIGIAVACFLVSALVSKKGNLILARIIYMVALNVSVAMTASYVGKAGSVEFLLMFALALPFLMFSFRREKQFVWIFSGLSGVLWLLLYFTDFALFTDTQFDPLIAGRYIYPMSIGSTLVLVTYQLVYFSFLNARFYSEINDKRQEAEEASYAKSRFLSTMSHEIRTPLNAIIGLSHILSDTKPRPDQVENIKALNYSGKILLGLLNNVLDFSKMESTKIELDPIPTDIAAALLQIKRLHAPSCLQKGIALNVDIDNTLPQVWLDIVRFSQVINNLVSNAIKFTEEGSVSLSISEVSKTNGSVRILTKVQDTGIGIDTEQQENIWEAFAQASSSTTRLYGGTGLGLPIVKSIVEAMGGEVHIESEAGKGSCFYFELEFNTAEVSTVEITPQEERTFEGKRILLVEDNMINVMVGRQVLEKASMSVEVAHDGKSALDIVKQHQFDAILMDIQMPIMDGYEAAIEIRKFNKDIPILALSASLFIEVKDRIFESGMNGFVYKPFEPEDLLGQLEQVLE